MSVPILENIAEFIKDAVAEITTGNGYNQTLTSIRPRRIHITDQINKDLQTVVTQGMPELLTGVAASDHLLTWRQPFIIEAIAIDSDDAATAIETRLNQIAADIQKKLAIDETCDGDAHYLDFEPPEYHHGEKLSVVKMTVNVTYRVLKTDPYTSG